MFTFGFYNSLNGDRKYNSVQISRLFEGIINDGVFASIGDSLMVGAGSGMTVNVGTGRAWFNNTWTDNDADIPLTLDAAEAILNRIDAIVLEVGSASDVRANTIKIVKGTPGSVPVAPTMIQMTGKYQYPLATIYVGAGVTSITSGNITSKINTTECPFVKVVGIEALTPIWENEFNTWFAALQAQMAGDVATNLQNQITANLNSLTAAKTKYGTCSTAAATAAKVVTQTEFTLTAGVGLVVLFTNVNTAANPTINVNETGAKAVYCNGVVATSSQIPKLAAFMYDGTYYQLLNPSYPVGVVPIANGGTGSTTAIGALTALGIRPGMFFGVLNSSVPAGFLECNGAAVSRTTYSALYTQIGTTYGAGDGSTTFKLPDFRGEFLRGWDNGRGIDTSRVIGSWQQATNGIFNKAAFANLQETETVGARENTSNQLGSTSGTITTPTAYAIRPRNIAVMWCVKY